MKSSDPTTFHEPDYTYRVVVDRIVDGDTIDVRIDVGFKSHIFKRLRFLDLDTEEINSREPLRRERARQAKARLEEILTSADKVFVQTVMDSTGKYGRILAWVWVMTNGEMINVNRLLKEEGFEKKDAV